MDTSLSWTCGNDKALICKRHINNGAYGDDYEVLHYLLLNVDLRLDGVQGERAVCNFRESTIPAQESICPKVDSCQQCDCGRRQKLS